jgi:hypothetical protein
MSMMPDSALSPPAVGRTVRELVESSPQLVTDGWCRQLAAQLLRSIETQQAMGRPHRIIMPDSIVVHADGAAELLSSADEDSEFQPPTAVDLKAIAAVLHFAITGESPPAGPLAPRQPPGLSDSLVEAIDACLYGDRQRRPQTIEAMRALLGVPVLAPQEAPSQAPPADVPPALAQSAPLPSAPLPVAPLPPAAASSAAPLLAPVEIAPAPPLPPARGSRAMLAAGALAVLAVAGYGLYQHGRQAGAESVLAATAAPAVPDAAALPAPAPAAAPAVAPAPAPVPAPAAPAPAETPTATAAPEPAAAAPTAAPATAPAPASATYKLVIKPWGTVYVDGVKRGISPPLKSLTLSGQHTIRIDNPEFRSRTIVVHPGKDTVNRIEHAFH